MIILISVEVEHRRWRWIGHVLQMTEHSSPRIALRWTLLGKRKMLLVD
jgi:hypothetical protein